MNELYGKIASFLGPSTGTSSLGTIGAFPQPQTASPLRHGLEPGSFAAGDRRAGVGLSPMLVEVVYKIDSKIKVGQALYRQVYTWLTVFLTENRYPSDEGDRSTRPAKHKGSVGYGQSSISERQGRRSISYVDQSEYRGRALTKSDRARWPNGFLHLAPILARINSLPRTAGAFVH